MLLANFSKLSKKLNLNPGMVKVDIVAGSVLAFIFVSFPNESPSLNKANLHTCTKISYFANAHAGLDIFCFCFYRHALCITFI